jgi:hypothetical protein
MLVSAISAIGAAYGVHKLNQKDNDDLRRQIDTLHKAAVDSNEAARTEHDSRKKGDLQRLAMVIENFQLKINAALQSGEIEDITFFLLWEAIVAELLEIQNRLKRNGELSERDKELLELVSSITKGKKDKSEFKELAGQMFEKHRKAVLTKFFRIIVNRELYLQNKIGKCEMQINDCIDEINKFEVKHAVEGLTEQESELLTVTRAMRTKLENEKIVFRDDIRRLQYFKVAVGKLSLTKNIKEINADPQLRRAMDIILKYLNGGSFTVDERRFLESFFMAYQKEVDDHIRSEYGAAA